VSNGLAALENLPVDERLAGLVALVDDALGKGEAVDDDVIQAMVGAVLGGQGSNHARLALGEALGRAGDPRLRLPGDRAYWVSMTSDLGDPLVIGAYPVTHGEFQTWVDAGGYQDRSAWSDEGWAWLQATDDPWPTASKALEPSFRVANQPVVYVTFHEAEAYARAHGARLARTDERLWVVRGEERRPYPWGAPFGEGNANTREEALGRPCAIGLFPGDQTPEGVCDLAGNVAEWTDDEEVDYVDFDAVDEGDEPPIRTCRTIHPGAWNQPALAAWAKAKALVVPESRWTALGFRLARDA
jgi:formylglycine-generating enzyme required for sulfatase activity